MIKQKNVSTPILEDIEYLSYNEMKTAYYDLLLAYESLNEAAFAPIHHRFLCHLLLKNKIYAYKYVAPQSYRLFTLLLTGKVLTRETILVNISTNEDVIDKSVDTVMSYCRTVFKLIDVKIINISKAGWYISTQDLKKYNAALDVFKKSENEFTPEAGLI